MRTLTALLLVLGLALASSTTVSAQRLRCVGDSLTEGKLPFDEEDRGGYPARLQRLLRQGGMTGIIVDNKGAGGETTVDMLSRFGGDLGDASILILLAGTNDIELILGGALLFEDTIDNLDFMLNFSQDSGVRPIVGTILPRRPDARLDRTNRTTYELVLRIRELAHRKRYELIDFWHAFPNRERSTYELFYYSGLDPVGHPNAAGFAIMAETAAGVVLDGDVQSPVEGRFRSPGEVEEIKRGTDIDIDLFDFGEGIFLPSATIVVNGEELETTVSGTRRKARLFADGLGKRRCKAVLSIRANDRAEPPNELDFFVFTYQVAGQTLIVGDGTGDCRVDGRDLARFGPVFGKSRTDPGFDEEFDFVRDGVIDGEDLSRLAANFGRNSL